MGYVKGEETHEPGQTVSREALSEAHRAVRAAMPEPAWGSTRYGTHGYVTTAGKGPITTPDLGDAFETKTYENKDGTRTIALRTRGSRGWYRGA